MKISFSRFLAAIAANEGNLLRTAGGEATFSAKRTERGVQFTPTSSGKPRRLSPAQIEPYISRFNRTGLMAPSDYADYRNHSYVPAIFKIIVGQPIHALFRKRTGAGEKGAELSTMGGKGKKVLQLRRPASGAILLKWNDRESRHYTDVLPLRLFATMGSIRRVVHVTRDRNFREYRAKCDVTVRRLEAELDYEPYAVFNTKHGMLLGVALLQFADTDRTALQTVQWKPRGRKAFTACPFDSSQFEVPPAPPYKPAGRATKKREQLVRERPGQAAFRRDLKSVYGNRCCITRCAVPEVLEGAHIDPYKSPASDSIRNGLLLRRDVHALFDKHLIGIELGTHIIHVADCARGVASYAALHKRRLKLPADPSHYPDPGALERHWRRFLKRPSLSRRLP